MIFLVLLRAEIHGAQSAPWVRQTVLLTQNLAESATMARGENLVGRAYDAAQVPVLKTRLK